ncbi:protein REVEILLE 7-like [Ziziphus jujuba]|uniref:Protein REVEILLE 7-like n=1 Tax=Ziziphus jujuba TaxID=326968 RepID=A0ABM4A2Y3_ZIZJJ|nr:protein REVEILLE 7-like [Ziziphus jujuba]
MTGYQRYQAVQSLCSPYPRKSVDFFKGTSVSNQTERSSSPEEGTKSPISVLSTLGSEAVDAPASYQHSKSSPSSTLCTTDMHSHSLSPLEKENDYTTSNSSAEEGKGSLPILENVLCTKFEPGSKDTLCQRRSC